MIWETVIINVDHRTGEILTNTNEFVMFKKEQTVNFKDHNHATKTIIKYFKPDPQQKIDWGFSTEIEQWQDEQP